MFDKTLRCSLARPPGGQSLIKMTGGLTLRFLPRALQQLKMLPRVDTKSIFGTLERTRYPILIVLERTNDKIVTSSYESETD